MVFLNHHDGITIPSIWYCHSIYMTRGTSRTGGATAARMSQRGTGANGVWRAGLRGGSGEGQQADDNKEWRRACLPRAEAGMVTASAGRVSVCSSESRPEFIKSGLMCVSVGSAFQDTSRNVLKAWGAMAGGLRHYAECRRERAGRGDILQYVATQIGRGEILQYVSVGKTET